MIDTGAATSLKYARAQDLPSYPSTGGVKMSSAGAAASLANNSNMSPELWKPGEIPAANKAAFLAKDHKMDPMWKPEATSAGSKAAMAAHANPTHVEPIQLRTSTTSKSAQPSAAYDTPENAHKKALMAATAVHNRNRSGSLPTQPVAKPTNSTSWAMKAATKSNKDGPYPSPQPLSSGDPGNEAARIQNMAKNNVNRQMYTSSPPVSIEVQEKNRQDTLRASAIAMAQKMYAIQQKHIDEEAGKTAGGNHALTASRARGTTSGSNAGTASDDSPYNYGNLEEAARKLAQERLAKLHDEHAEYRQYYGATTSPPPKRFSSLRTSRRRTSNAAEDDSDEEQSKKIRSQMSIFQSRLADVDTKKRQQDRDNLLQIAHRNVDAQMSKMDKNVFEETGKISPAQMEQWEKSAREKAQAESDERMKYTGKVNIGGGKYLEQSELDAIARARLQPTLDEIYDKAEKQRARDEEMRMERERKEQQDSRDKARAAEIDAQLKADKGKCNSLDTYVILIFVAEKERQAERARKDEEKRVQREEQSAEQARRNEEKRAQKSEQAAEKERARLAKEEQNKSKEEQNRSKEKKPSRFSSIFGRGGAAASTGAAVVLAPGAAVGAGVAKVVGGAGTADAAVASPHEETSTTIEPEEATTAADADADDASMITAPEETATSLKSRATSTTTESEEAATAVAPEATSSTIEPKATSTTIEPEDKSKTVEPNDKSTTVLTDSEAEPKKGISGDDGQEHASVEGTDPSSQDKSGGKLTGSGAPGSHSAVFGLTPDGHKFNDTKNDTEQHAGGSAEMPKAREGEPEDKSKTVEPEAISETPIEGDIVHDLVTDSTSNPTSASPEKTKVEPEASSAPTSTSLEVTKSEPEASSPAKTQVAPPVSEKKSPEGRKSTEKRTSVDENRDIASSPKQSRVKSWMKGRFRSKSNAQKQTNAMPAVAEADAETEKEKSVDRDEGVSKTESEPKPDAATGKGKTESVSSPDAVTEKDKTAERGGGVDTEADTWKSGAYDRDQEFRVEDPKDDLDDDLPKENASGRNQEVPRTDSMRDVAMAGRTTPKESDDLYGAGKEVSAQKSIPNNTTKSASKEVSPQRSIPNKSTRSRSTSISSLSSTEDGEGHKPRGHFDLGTPEGYTENTTAGTSEPTAAEAEERGRAGFTTRFMDMIMPGKEKTTDEPMTPVATNKSNTTDDDFEESRDKFEEEKLAPPPSLARLTGETSGTKTVSPRGSRERSKFTEEL